MGDDQRDRTTGDSPNGVTSDNSPNGVTSDNSPNGAPSDDSFDEVGPDGSGPSGARLSDLGDAGTDASGPADAGEPDRARHELADEVPYDYGDPDATPSRRAENWRRRSATGAMLTGFAFGLREILEPDYHEPAIVLETSGLPPKDLPVEADFENLPPRQSVVKIRRWLLPVRPPPATKDGSAPDGDGTDTEEGVAPSGPPAAAPDDGGPVPTRVTELRSRARRPSRPIRFGRSKGRRT